MSITNLGVANILSASTCVSIIFLFAKIEKQFQITKIIALYKYIKQKKYGIFYKSMINLSFLLYTSNPQPIGFSGILLAKRQNSFYCTYFLHNRNVADTKSPYSIKRLEVIRWFNQKSMVFNQSLS